MEIDTRTALLMASTITFTVSIALLLFSFSRQENRPFIWASLSSGSFAASQMLLCLRGEISELFTIVLANALAVLCLIAYFEVIRQMLRIRTRASVIGPILLLIQIGLFFWYTFVEPNFTARVILINIAFCIMSACIIKLLLIESPRKQRASYLISSLPFLIVFFVSVIRVINASINPEQYKFSFESQAFSFLVIFYACFGIWSVLSLVFIVNNRVQAQVTEMALLDPLTGTFNRRALKDVIKREIAHSKRTASPLSIIIADLDHFKKINDTYGHQVGDAVLTNVVAVIKTILRLEDVLARYGGEEFVIVLPGIEVDRAIEVAERLRLAIKNQRLVIDRYVIDITSSFGVTGFHERPLDYETLIRHVDEALYQAKAFGRDKVVRFEPDWEGEEETPISNFGFQRAALLKKT